MEKSEPRVFTCTVKLNRTERDVLFARELRRGQSRSAIIREALELVFAEETAKFVEETLSSFDIDQFLKESQPEIDEFLNGKGGDISPEN